MGKGTLEDYKKEAFSERQNLCSNYRTLWESCKNKKELIDMMMSTTGIDYTCDSINKGWGMTTDYLKSQFDMFMNGNYISNQKRYDSRLFCDYKGCIAADVTVYCIIGGEIEIQLEDWQMIHIFATENAVINIKGKGRVSLNHYGDVTFNGAHPKYNCNPKWKVTNKKERDNYE